MELLSGADGAASSPRATNAPAVGRWRQRAGAWGVGWGGIVLCGRAMAAVGEERRVGGGGGKGGEGGGDGPDWDKLLRYLCLQVSVCVRPL